MKQIALFGKQKGGLKMEKNSEQGIYVIYYGDDYYFFCNTDFKNI